MQRHVGGARAVHADHAEVVSSLRLDRSQSVYRGKGRNLQVIEQRAQFADRAGKFGARADQRDRLLGVLQQRNQSFGESSGRRCRPPGWAAA